MLSINTIKQHNTPVDKQGGYRRYVVYRKENLFIFEYWDCSVTNINNDSVGVRKIYNEFSKKEDAISEYERYLEV